jgi:predicted anti-sigma-YlaC factor YlaD
MTCHECLRTIAETDIGAETRAVRAVVLRHLAECPVCVGLLEAVAADEPPETPEEAAAIQEQCDQDHRDPEYLEVRYGRARNSPATGADAAPTPPNRTGVTG